MEPGEYIINNKKYKLPKNLDLTKNIKITDTQILDEMYVLLLELDKLLNKNKIQYFISSGTLLGYQRHGGFIPWDNDVDICIFDTDLQKMQKLAKNLENKNYPFNIKKVDPGFVFLKKKFMKKTFIDISILSLTDNRTYKYGYPYKNGKPTYNTSLIWPKDIFYKKYIFPLKRKKFLDFKINIPNNPEKILFQLYDEKCLTEYKYSKIKNIGHSLVASIRDKNIFFEKILSEKLYIKLAKYYSSK